MSQTILFLCPHGAAKSVLAAAYCQQLADQHHLDMQATSAGTEPDAAVSPAVVELLLAEGIDVADHVPRRVTRQELETAFRVISLGCDLGDLLLPGTSVEQWDDVPSPSQNLTATRELILTHVEWLIGGITRAESRL